MALQIHAGAPTLLLRRKSYEKAGIARAAVDELLGLTDEEFRVEADVVAIGPVYDDDAFAALLERLESLGLRAYDDFFELTGNWPEWLAVLVSGRSSPLRSNPSQPHS